MNEKEAEAAEEAWVSIEREKVITYLVSQDCGHAGVGDWPAFHIDPYIALWAVQSPANPGKIGWWAISGDVPTDYMSSSSGYHPRDAMRYFSIEWLSIAESMRKGEEHPRTKMGTPELWPEMAPLLESRAGLLKEFADDDQMWDE